ncbi:MAG: class I SAM-dependent methyltransferase [Moorea sp. SIO2B7]|nr:class I SAM-dependent methyltransferase [Moorena sp. SIO2B7]
MASGYYNHAKIAQAIAAFISPKASIIEIGVGTGLLLEKLLEIDPQYDLTGMDPTPTMLALAKKRLGDRVKLFEADILSMSILDHFDVAISNGGLCAFVDSSSECQ